MLARRSVRLSARLLFLTALVALAVPAVPAAAASCGRGFWPAGGGFGCFGGQVRVLQLVADQPAVDSVAPAAGPAAGGTSVTITGSGFADASGVDFGAVDAASFSVDSDTQITAVSPAEAAGTVDVTVVSDGGTSDTSAADVFTFVAAPAVDAVVPSQGSTAGGTAVTITGSAFSGAAAVSFGNTPAASFSVDSDAQISAVSPPAAAGPLDVTVTTADGGTSAPGPADTFLYVAPPEVDSVHPTSGPEAGGTVVTIAGDGFTGASAVAFGAHAAASYTVDSDTRITAVAPAAAAGTVHVTVTTGVGTSATSPADRFRYVRVPSVTGVAPSSGPTFGGTTVTIAGSGFTGATEVDFGAAPAPSFSVDADGQITATTPAAAAATVDVTVTSANGTSAATPADSFTFVAPSTQLTLSAATGPPTGRFSVSGKGLAPNELVDLYFDTGDQASVTTDAHGAFPAVGVQVPASAVPGTHWVTAVGRRSGASAQAAFVVGTDWAQAGFGATRQGDNTFENVLTVASVTGLAPLWGAVGAGLGDSSPAVVGSSLFVGASDGTVRALDASTGAIRWQAATGGAVTSPAVAGSLVLVGSADGKLYAFNASTGTAVWTATIGSPLRAAPTVAGVAVYIGADNGRLYAYTIASGARRWSAATGGAIDGAAAVSGANVFVGSSDGRLYDFNLGNGALAWSSALGGPIHSSVGFAAGNPVVGADDGNVYALDAKTGARLWTAATGGPVRSSPAAAPGRVFVGSDDGRLYAFDPNGCAASPCAPLWTTQTGGPIRAAPTVANDVVYVASDDGNAYAVAGSSGAIAWSAPTGGAIRSSIAVANGRVYVASRGSRILGFAAGPGGGVPRPDPTLLQPFTSPIRHVVVIYQENHSFDDVLGALCVSDGRCDGATTGKLKGGAPIPLGHEPDLVPNVDHRSPAQATAIDGGAMDGFSLIKGCTGAAHYACYVQLQPVQIPALSALARRFVISDRTFELDGVPSWGGHFDLVATQLDGFTGDNPSDRPGEPKAPPRGWGCDSFRSMLWRDTLTSPPVWEPSCVPAPDGTGPYRASPVSWVPTIMDRLDGASLGWTIYVDRKQPAVNPGWSICPTFAECLYGSQVNALRGASQVISDGRAGTLPNLSIVIPNPQVSQHNNFSMLQGDNWIGSIVNALMSGPEWSSTAIFITYDDCGCFYDHVPPPPHLGIRVPMVIVSPYARPGFTDSHVASYASMLAFTEHAFGLDPVGTSDANAYDFSASFDFGGARTPAIRLQPRALPPAEARLLRTRPPEPPFDT